MGVSSTRAGYSQHPDLSLVGVLSGIEMACWDIVGKALDQPVYNLLGGQVHEKLRSYTYLYPAPDSETKDVLSVADAFGDAELAPQRAAQYVDQGFYRREIRPRYANVSLRPKAAFPGGAS